MITIDKIKNDFSFLNAWSENSEVYHDTIIFEGYGIFCDLYFKSNNKQIKQEQVDQYNDFRVNFKNYLPKIETYILSSLNKSEQQLKATIQQTSLYLDVIEIAYENFKYDLVLVCSKTYKKFFFLTRSIDIRVEFKNGNIVSMQRKKDTTTDNV
jgi:hypothetical protein